MKPGRVLSREQIEAALFSVSSPPTTSHAIADIQRAVRNYRVLHMLFDAADDTEMAYHGLQLSIARDRSSLEAALREAAWLGATTALAALAILIPLLQRTPVSELRALAELATQWTDEATPAAFSQVLEITSEMEAVVASLTLLNRLEATASPISCEPVNLSPILLRIIERSAPPAAAAGLRLSCPDLSSAITWETDATLWKAAAANLLGNAISYSSPGSLITVSLTPSSFAVLNPAPSLQHEDLAHMTQPFWRRDKARSASRYSGLGLAIVDSITSHLGHGFTLSLTPDGLLAATMTAAIQTAAPAEPT